MTSRIGRITKALHALLASSGAASVADALTRLHGEAQVGGLGVGVAALAAAAVSWAKHSSDAEALAHAVEMDASRLVTPQVTDRLRAIETEVAAHRSSIGAAVAEAEKIPGVESAVAETRARLEQVAALVPEVDMAKLRPLVIEILGPLAKVLDTPPPAPVAPVEGAPETPVQ